jgi:NADH-quinone oxidoreductase subunit A
MTATSIVGYLALFVTVGILFLFVNLLVGWLLRPSDPTVEKGEVYECGEPTIGSSFVQFDLRFYVVALLFIIFDVEVAFFFPWATVFGKATHLMDPNFPKVTATAPPELTPEAANVFAELGARSPYTQVPADLSLIDQTARSLALTTLADIAVFFAVLLVGFAYVWKRGDLDWVRAVSKQKAASPPRPTGSTFPDEEPALAG